MFTNALWAQMAAPNVLLQRCYYDYVNIYKYLKEDKAFAYARVELGEEDYCVWSHKATSESHAINSALQACRKKPIDAQCKIVDINGNWSVPDGAFSSILPPDNTPLSTQLYAQLVAQARNIVLGECFTLFERHLQDKGHKAFAYSVDEDGKFACASSKEQQTLRTAGMIALKRCEEQKHSMGKNAPKNQCLTYSAGKKIYLSAKDYQLTLHPKNTTYMMQKEYLQYVNEGEKYLSGACMVQYKYYLRDKEHKAFYVARDEQGQVACGRSVNAFTVSYAKKDAFKKCVKSMRQKKLEAKCELFMLNSALRYRTKQTH